MVVPVLISSDSRTNYCYGHAGVNPRVEDAMAKIESDHATAAAALRKAPSQMKVVVTVDVEELRCPIELEVGPGVFGEERNGFGVCSRPSGCSTRVYMLLEVCSSGVFHKHTSK